MQRDTFHRHLYFDIRVTYSWKGWNGKGLFWNVFTGLPGSFHGRVLRLSTLWELSEKKMLFPNQIGNTGGPDAEPCVLSDAVYALQSWSMQPFSENEKLTVERRRVDGNEDLVKSMVLTCALRNLYNLCENILKNIIWGSPHSTQQKPDDN